MAALEGSRVAVYESAVCIVLSGNIYVLYTRSREVTWLFSGRNARFSATGTKGRNARRGRRSVRPLLDRYYRYMNVASVT